MYQFQTSELENVSSDLSQMPFFIIARMHRIPRSLIRGRFGVVMDVFGGYYYFSVLWIFSAQAEQCFLRLLDI